MTKSFYNIHDLFYLQSEIDTIPPSFKLSHPLDRPLDLIIEIKENSFFSNFFKNAVKIMPGIYFHANDNVLVSRINIFKVDCLLAIKDFDKPSGTQLTINKSFYYFTKHIVRQPLSSLFPIEHFIKLFLLVNLLKKNAVMVLAAGIRFKGKNILISSFGSIGKTTLVLDMFRRNDPGFQYLSDDTCLVNNRSVYGYPQKVRIRGKGAEFFHFEKFVDPIQVVGENIIKKFEPDLLVFLERSQLCEKHHISPGEASHRLRVITEKILPFSFERHIAALDYIYGFSAKYSTLFRECYDQTLAIPGVVLLGHGSYYLEKIDEISERN